MKIEKAVLEAHFFHVSSSIGPFVSKNNKVYLPVKPHQSCEFHENWFKTATYIVRSYTYIYVVSKWSIISVL